MMSFFSHCPLFCFLFSRQGLGLCLSVSLCVSLSPETYQGGLDDLVGSLLGAPRDHCLNLPRIGMSAFGTQIHILSTKI